MLVLVLHRAGVVRSYCTTHPPDLCVKAWALPQLFAHRYMSTVGREAGEAGEGGEGGGR